MVRREELLFIIAYYPLDNHEWGGLDFVMLFIYLIYFYIHFELGNSPHDNQILVLFVYLLDLVYYFCTISYYPHDNNDF